MEALTRLAQLVSRAFYTGQAVVVMDLLLPVHSMREEELAALLKIKPKEVSKVCARLQADRLLQTTTILVDPPYKSMRKIPKTFYYIDWKYLVDAIKYKIHRMGKRIEEEAELPTQVDYHCPVCRRTYTTMEMLLLDTDAQRMPLCEVCGHLVSPAQEAVQAATKVRDSSKYVVMMQELSPIITCLKATENLVIPEKLHEFSVHSVKGVPLSAAEVEAEGGLGVAGVQGTGGPEQPSGPGEAPPVVAGTGAGTEAEAEGLPGTGAPDLDASIQSYYNSLLQGTAGVETAPTAPPLLPPSGLEAPGLVAGGAKAEVVDDADDDDADDEEFVEV